MISSKAIRLAVAVASFAPAIVVGGSARAKLAANRIASNGVALNGVSLNGKSLNGVAANGAVAARSEVQFDLPAVTVSAVTLPDGTVLPAR